MTLTCELIKLIGREQARTGLPMNLSILSREIGVPHQILSKMARQQMKRYDARLLEKICRRLRCSVGDLLVVTDDE